MLSNKKKNMNRKIVITGATGLIGSKLCKLLIDDGDELTIFSRSAEKAKGLIKGAVNYIEWNSNSDKWKSYLEDQYAVIHLAGENVMAKRWNDEHKQRILESRVSSTKALASAIADLKIKPKVFISASAIGYYGNREDFVDEESGKGNDFLADLVDKWERASKGIEQFGIRRVCIRTGIVLDKSEGALAKMITPFKYFVGGAIGSGNQWLSWIHIDDLVSIFKFALDNEIGGIINGVAPNAVRMKTFAKTLGRVMKRPSLFNVPSFILRIMLGEGAGSVLGGVNVKPKTLEQKGFAFIYKDIDSSLTAILNK